MHSFDVIVIGSGPAGCSAAITSALSGLKVLLITDKDEQDGASSINMAAIESIHPGVVTFLDTIGISRAAPEAAVGYYFGIYHNGEYASLGHDEDGAWRGMHILRDVFDHRLLQYVKDTNVTLACGERVEDFLSEDGRVVGVKTKTGEWFSSYCIDATGKSGIGGKKLNFKRQFFSPPLFCWTGVSGEMDIYPFDQTSAHFIPKSQGWTWLAPLPPDQCAWTRLTLNDAKAYLSPEEIKDHPVIGSIRFANMRWRLYRPLCKEGIVLCGDAAGILDPAAGQGILNSLRSGVMAANTIMQCLKDPDRAAFHLALYDNWFVQQFEMKVNQLGEYYEKQGIKLR